MTLQQLPTNFFTPAIQYRNAENRFLNGPTKFEPSNNSNITINGATGNKSVYTFKPNVNYGLQWMTSN